MNCPSVQHLCRPSAFLVESGWGCCDSLQVWSWSCCGDGQDTGVSTAQEGLLLHFHSIAMIFNVWYLSQQQQPGTCLEMQFIWPHPDLLNQKLWRRGPTVWISKQAFQGFQHMLQGEATQCYYILGQLGQSRFKDGLPWWPGGRESSCQC